ncbi:MAG TPA: PQQ-dependent sugar dehydrogenase [Bacteroidota bacterium]|nr:PQQ-dependent sugar dehydrogenase [Bacteroidota bacterium]
MKTIKKLNHHHDSKGRRMFSRASIVLGIFLAGSLQFTQAQTVNRILGKQLVRTFSNLAFSQPTFLTNAGDGTDRIFVTERPGRVYVFPNNPSVTTTSRKTFLNIAYEVSSTQPSGEPGLLSIAFHPHYAENGKFYVCYTDTIAGNIRDSVYAGAMMLTVSEFHVSATNPDSADPSSERVLLAIQKLWDNHNAGQIAFGPDGYLYISFGDGKETSTLNDPFMNGQKMTTWFGKVLRIDVDHQDPGLQYSIPSDNPFVGNANGWKEEIYALGLRNPWRFSFDKVTGNLWLADAGAKEAEEIDIVTKGCNLGWSIMEGTYCFNGPNCDTTGLTMPVFEYTHDGKGSTVVIIGGYVYRGTKLPDLQGMYIYGDYGYKAVWGLEYSNGVVQGNSLLATSAQDISSFGADEEGEVYLVGYNGSNSYIYTLQNDGTKVGDVPKNGVPTEYSLSAPYPNPFNPSTTIAFDIPIAGHVTIAVYNSQGQKVVDLANRWYESGRYTVAWDGKDSQGNSVATGPYLYTMESGHFKQTGKMLLLK